MADFQDFIDFFAFFGHQFLDPEMRPYLPRWPLSPPHRPIGGAIIHCDAVLQRTQAPNDSYWELFSSQLVDSLDPIRGHIIPAMGDVSELSVRCGMPLRLLRIRRPSLHPAIGDWPDLGPNRANLRADYLMNTFRRGACPQYEGSEVNDVLVVRVDDQDLTQVQILAMYEMARAVAHGTSQATPEMFAQRLSFRQAEYDSRPPAISRAASLSSRKVTLPILEHRLL